LPVNPGGVDNNSGNYNTINQVFVTDNLAGAEGDIAYSLLAATVKMMHYNGVSSVNLSISLIL